MQPGVRRVTAWAGTCRCSPPGLGTRPCCASARPAPRRAVARSGEPAVLPVRRGNRSLAVPREESMQSLRAGGWVGRSSPLHCTASGRALLFAPTTTWWRA
ncbi:IclR family transcriptional regulator domain-containing protein [Streptomyces sp. NBC_00483]|uniref:IclR family transcriptional regulator domain-containing protein n=1 Tax=Streptomyces sp. NBC_00483 TaxID=2975756 RepID=UPI003FCE3402